MDDRKTGDLATVADRREQLDEKDDSEGEPAFRPRLLEDPGALDFVLSSFWNFLMSSAVGGVLGSG